MIKTQQLNEKWIKASILGTIWASSEIVLGSFLHNLRVPFSGNILTAIGLVILISASYQWKEQGLFWRSGIICALLKTMSPSAVIFGPMVAIVSEALFLEFSVRFFGKTISGFLLGSILAMSWNLFQKIFNYIIYYGYNIVELYTNLMEYAQRQLHLQFDVVWAPILLLLLLYAAFGAIAALVGIKTGRRLIDNKFQVSEFNPAKTETNNVDKKINKFNYSILWLISNVILLTGILILINRIPFGIWVLIVVSVITTWAFRYKRALRQLVRPKLWIFFIVITMFAAVGFYWLQPDSTTFTDAIFIGIEMNLRAIILIMGFTVLGTELYHPQIREYLAKSYFKQLPPALELSLESLPFMIANIPDLKSIVKHPVLVIHQIMSHAEIRLSEIRNKNKFKQKIFILTGGVGQGKTRCIINLTEKLLHKNLKIEGIYSSRIIKNNKTTGYEVVDIATYISKKFLDITGKDSFEKIGKFYIYPDGLQHGKVTLNNCLTSSSNLVIIDEIGKLELSGRGWFDNVNQLIQTPEKHLLLSVREDTVPEIISKWDIQPEIICNLSKINCSDLYQLIAESVCRN